MDTERTSLRLFKVGGWVRDTLLGLPVADADWVVVGATPEVMLAQGFRQVGADFPVFLHPLSGEEYALARQETKLGRGYHGFSVQTTPDISLAMDLARRDLTINALAMDADGNVIDPYGGLQDLQAGVLRHVSAAFGEDPLRVLRVARLLARFHSLGFRIAPETLHLMRSIATSGELHALTPERIWLETQKALETTHPSIYFTTLAQCGALVPVFPELANLVGQEQPAKHHPEGDAWNHSLMVLDQATILSPDPMVRFAALVHDLGKGMTDKATLPHHYGHEKTGGDLVRVLCCRLKIPRKYAILAERAASNHMCCHRAQEMRPHSVIRLLTSIDAFRQPELFQAFLLVCQADLLGRGPSAPCNHEGTQLLHNCYLACLAIDHQAILATGARGKQFGDILHKERINRVSLTLRQHQSALASKSKRSSGPPTA